MTKPRRSRHAIIKRVTESMRTTMDDPTKTTVYLLVKAEVQDGNVVNGDVAISRAARTLNDLIYEGRLSRMDESGMILFHTHGEVKLNHPSILPKRVMEFIDEHARKVKEWDLTHGVELI